MSKKKVFATSAAAVLAASAVTPAVTFAAENTFPDMPADQEMADAISYLVENGIVQGYDDGNFYPKYEVTRAQSAEMLYKALDLPVKGTENYTDVESDHWFYDAVVATTTAGIFEGYEGKFGPQDNLTREQAAKILVEAFGLEGSADLSFEDTDEISGWAKSYVETAYANGIIKGREGNVFDPQASITRAEFAVMVKRAIDATAAPAVVSVNALNGLELVVKFNKPVSEEDATTDKVTLVQGADEVAWAGAELSEDGKTLTLTASEVIAVQDATLTVEPIKLAADEKVKTARYVTLFTYKDTEAPTVVKVDAKGEQAVIAFNEQINTTDGLGISVNGNNNVGFEVSEKTITIPGLENGKTYNVEIVGAEDFAGNVSNPINLNFTVAKPDAPVEQSVTTSVKENKVTLNFAKALPEGDPATISFDATGDVFTLDGTATAGVTYSDDNKTVVIDTQAAGVLDGLNFLNTKVVISGAGLKDDVSVNLSLTADKTPAKLVSAQTTADRELVLEFNEEVLNPGTLDVDVTHIDGIYQDPVDEYNGLPVAYGKDSKGNDVKNKLVVTLPVEFEVGKSYKIEVPKVVNDVYGNVTDKFGVSVQIPEKDETADPKAVITVTPDADGDNVIKLTFAQTSEKGLTDSATNIANYTLAGKALPSGTVVRFVNDRNHVEIVLPENAIKTTGKYVLTLKNLVDSEGNTLADGYDKLTVDLVENVSPVAKDLVVKSSSEVQVTFSEAVQHIDDIDSNGKIDGITVKKNGSKVDDTKLTFAVDNTSLTINGLDLNVSDTVTVEFKDAELYDFSFNNNQLTDAVVSSK